MQKSHEGTSIQRSEKRQALPDSILLTPATARASGEEGRDRWWLIALAIVLIAPFVPILVSPDGRVLGHASCDSASAYYHFVHFLGKCLREGILPLWNPHIMLGIPFIGEGQGSVFHPVSLMFACLKAGLALNWMVVTAFVLTGVFFFGYLRALGLARPACWCGAVTWSFSSAMISRIYAGHLNILLTYISIPLIMMCWEHYRVRGRVRYLVGIAFAYGMMIFAFYPQVLYIFSLFFLFYVLIQSIHSALDGSSTIEREGKAILMLGLFIVIGIGVGAVQLLPSIDFVSRSFRQESTMKFCSMFSFPPENILTIIAPGFFGTMLTTGPGRYWGRNLFWEMWIYIGVLPLLMAVAGTWFAPRARRIALLICCVIFAVLSLGKNTSLYPFIYEHVPLFDVFRGSSKNAIVILFCLVTLSAYGFQALFGEKDPSVQRKYRWCVVISGAVVLLVCGVLMFFLRDFGQGSHWERFVMWLQKRPDEIYFILAPGDVAEFIKSSASGARAALVRAMILVGLSIALIFLKLPQRWRSALFGLPIALVLADLLGVFVPLIQTFDSAIAKPALVLDETAQTPYPPRILVPFNKNPNIAIRSGYSSAFGYAGNTLKRYNDFINGIQRLDPKESRSESLFYNFTPQFSMLSFDGIAVDREMVLTNLTPIGKLGDKIVVPYRETPILAPRAFLAAAPRYVARREDALAYVLSNQVNVVESPAIERVDELISAEPLQNQESVRFLSYSPNRVELEARTMHPRELVVCGMFERNWKAEVDGVSSPINPANYVFRAIQVPRGVSRVVLEYKPAPFYWGALVTGLSTCGLMAILIVPVIRSGRSRQSGVIKQTEPIPGGSH